MTSGRGFTAALPVKKRGSSFSTFCQTQTGEGEERGRACSNTKHRVFLWDSPEIPLFWVAGGEVQHSGLPDRLKTAPTSVFSLIDMTFLHQNLNDSCKNPLRTADFPHSVTQRNFVFNEQIHLYKMNCGCRY